MSLAMQSKSLLHWCKFVSFAAKWRKFQCREGEIAIEAASNLGLKLDDLPSGGEFAETPSSSGQFSANTSLLQVPSRLLQLILQHSYAWQRRKETEYSR